MSKRTAVIPLSLAALSAVPAAIAPVAQADVCGDVGGRHVSVGGCNVAGELRRGCRVAGAAVVGVDDWARYGFPQSYAYSVVPAFPGEAPCISLTGLEYYTPGAEPCYVP
ncbi:MAG: hypothetical protein U0S13_08820 [Mycobacterium sp.]